MPPEPPLGKPGLAEGDPPESVREGLVGGREGGAAAGAALPAPVPIDAGGVAGAAGPD